MSGASRDEDAMASRSEQALVNGLMASSFDHDRQLSGYLVYYIAALKLQAF